MGSSQSNTCGRKRSRTEDAETPADSPAAGTPRSESGQPPLKKQAASPTPTDDHVQNGIEVGGVKPVAVPVFNSSTASATNLKASGGGASTPPSSTGDPQQQKLKTGGAAAVAVAENPVVNGKASNVAATSASPTGTTASQMETTDAFVSVAKSPSALFDACAANELGEVIQLLREGTYINVINDRFGDEQDTALLLAAREGNIAMVCALLAAGANPGQLDTEGWSALHSVATDKQGGPAISVLLDLAPRIVDLADGDGWTALMIAAQEENLEAVKMLLDRGANPSLKDGMGRVALHWAAGNDRDEVAKLILGADKSLLNAPDGEGRTPVIVAAQSGGGIAVVKYLKAQGADLTIRDNEGKTALDWAKEEERPEEMLEVLESHENEEVGAAAKQKGDGAEAAEKKGAGKASGSLRRPHQNEEPVTSKQPGLGFEGTLTNSAHVVA